VHCRQNLAINVSNIFRQSSIYPLHSFRRFEIVRV
jgi:hypothetical protein